MNAPPQLGGLRVAFFLMLTLLALSNNPYANIENLITINEAVSNNSH